MMTKTKDDMGGVMLTPAEQVKLLVKEFVRAIDDAGITLSPFAHEWQCNTRSSAWYQKRADFAIAVSKIARACSVKYYEKRYYMFDGKIYKVVDEGTIYYAYQQFLLDNRIVRMYEDKTVFKNAFCATVKQYNLLTPNKSYVAFSNGVLELDSHELREFSPKYHVTYMHPYKFDKYAKCPTWKKFLSRVLPSREQRIVLRMFLGLGFIERGTSYNKYEGKDYGKVELCLMMIGSGANGKSTIYNVAAGIFGKGRISSTSYSDMTLSGEEGQRARRAMRDKLFNWISDGDSTAFGKKGSGMFKRIVSGEPVEDRAIGGNVEENDSLPYLVFTLNDMPTPKDASLGFMRRLQYLTFDVIIPPEEQDLFLDDKLRKEYPGILNWILGGSVALRRNKFHFPVTSAGLSYEMRVMLQSNPVQAWVVAYGLRGFPMTEDEDYAALSAKDLYESYQTFCDDNNGELVGERMFSRVLTNMRNKVRRVRTNGRSFYRIYGTDEFKIKAHIYIEDVEERERVERTSSYFSFGDLEDEAEVEDDDIKKNSKTTK